MILVILGFIGYECILFDQVGPLEKEQITAPSPLNQEMAVF